MTVEQAVYLAGAGALVVWLLSVLLAVVVGWLPGGLEPRR